MSAHSIDEVIAFWFEQLGSQDWFRKDVKLDATIKERFGALYDALKLGVPAAWLSEPHGVLASVLVLDQFPRNIFRGDEHSFATDAAALAIAKRAIAEGVDAKLPELSAGSSIFRSSTPRTAPTRRARSSCSPRLETRARSTTPFATKRSSIASADSPTATLCSGVSPRKRRRTSSSSRARPFEAR